MTSISLWNTVRTAVAVPILLSAAVAFAPAQIYVDAAATGAGNGDSWTNAYTTVNGALGAASANDEIWVAEGRYVESLALTTAHNDIALYGGLASGATTTGLRNFVDNETVLDGALSVLHVIDIQGISGANSVEGLRIDGFTVTGGLADGAGANDDNRSGAGMFLNFVGDTSIVANCKITSNVAAGPDGSNRHRRGAGVYSQNSDLTFEDCVISDNTTIGGCVVANDTDKRGGGMYLGSGVSPTFRNCQFIHNVNLHTSALAARHYGGAMYLSGTPRFYDCVFASNTIDSPNIARGYGGVAFIANNANCLFENCLMVGNSAANSGGAFFVSQGNSDSYQNRFLNCVFAGNVSDSSGGVFRYQSISVYNNSRLGNCVFDMNRSASAGTSVFLEGGSSFPPDVTMSNCIFMRNNQQAINSWPSSDSPLRSCLFYDNDSALYIIQGVRQIFNIADLETYRDALDTLDTDPRFTTPSLGQSAEAKWDAVGSAGNRAYLTDNEATFTPMALVGQVLMADVTFNGGPGQREPLVVVTSNSATMVEVSGPAHLYAAPDDTYAFLSYRIDPDSPCLDAGTEEAWTLTDDIDGEPRDTLGGADYDIGVDEIMQPSPAYVDVAAAGDGNGTTWDNAFTSVQTAIDTVDYFSVAKRVWVAGGTYPEALDIDVQNMEVYGGLADNATTTVGRDFTANASTIDASTARGGLPEYHACRLRSACSNLRLDGFTITGGRATDNTNQNYEGAGVFAKSVDETNTMANCVITSNIAGSNDDIHHRGGGVHLDDCQMIFEDCQIIENALINEPPALPDNRICYGAGVYLVDSADPGPTFRRCLIGGNLNYSTLQRCWGAGAYSQDSAVLFEDCVIAGNSADTVSGSSASAGGAWFNYIDNAKTAKMTNCLVVGNSCESAGGGLFFVEYGAGCRFENTLIGGNRSNTGGGVQIQTNSAIAGRECSPTFVNCAIVANRCPGGSNGGGVHFVGAGASAPTFANCTITGNSAPGVSESPVSAPTFESCHFDGNEPNEYRDGSGNTYDTAADIDTYLGPGDEHIVDGAPLFTHGATGTWSEAGDHDGMRTVLTDDSASWTPGEHVGRIIEPDTSFTGVNSPSYAYVIANTANTLTVLGNVSDYIQQDDPYRFLDFTPQGGSPLVDAGTDTVPNGLGSAPSTDFAGAARPVLYNFDSSVPGFDIGIYELPTSVSESGPSGVKTWTRY